MMIRDLFVPRNIKKKYSRRPMSVNKFIKTFEECFNLKLDKDFKAIFKEIYKNSYTTTKQLIHIFGIRDSGRTTLCKMILIYDAIRNSCLFYPGGKFPIWVIADTMKNYITDDLKNHMNYFLPSCYVAVKTVTSYNMNELLGVRSGSYVDDGSNCSNEVKTLTFDKFIRSVESEDDFISHYIITYDAHSAETYVNSIYTDNMRMKIYLKDRAHTT